MLTDIRALADHFLMALPNINRLQPHSHSNLGKDDLLFYWGGLRNLDTTKDVRHAPINPTRPANKIWDAKVTRKCHVSRYYHGPASQGISMSTLA